MISSFESLSNELFFEIFEYLSPCDMFRSFINVNNLFNSIIYSYPLHLNFRSISRLEFDYICYNLRPKQVISLILSDETIPYQVHLFKKYFPFFKNEFINLQSLTLIEMFDDIIDLPESVRYLEIRKFDTYKNFGFNFDELLEQQAKYLIHLKIDRIGLLNSLNTQFPNLTHLTIDGGFSPNEDCYIRWSDQYKNIDIISIFKHLNSSITHLYLFIDKENRNMKINLEQFSHCLTHLTLHFVEDIIVSFQSIEEYLFNLHNLTHLTIQATGKNDLIDGNQWKKFLLTTNIIKFNFKFQLLNINEDESILLKSFRSSFWLKEKHFYVGYCYDEYDKKTLIYSIPRFRLNHINYPSSNFPYKTTAPSDIQEKLFNKNKIDFLFIDIDKFQTPPISRFTQVKSLIYYGSTLMPLDILKTILDLNQIEELDVCSIRSLSRHELYKLIKVLPRLNSLTMKFNPLFVIPSQIHTLILEGDSRSISIDQLYHTIKNVKTLQIPTNSKDMMLDIIDQLDHLENIIFTFDEFNEGEYLEFFIEKLSVYWMEDNCHRLAMNHFTFRQGEEYQEIHMSFGGPKTKKYSENYTYLN
ncbi:unnamed protein product [Rotaria sp. Silwood1]|nr:unnamed protein product [Rotaria sp. Silwood1]CAF1617333.1 unnamed protein product [Rotaria sp. Silwood1]